MASLTTCVITGTLRDIAGDALTLASVVVAHESHFLSTENEVIGPSYVRGTTDTSGSFQISLLETSTNSITTSWEFQYTSNNMKRRLKFTGVVIPNTTSATFISLTGVT